MIARIREPINTITHFIGAMLSIVAFAFLLHKSIMNNSAVQLITSSIFCIGLIGLYSTSSLYHGLKKNNDIISKLKFKENINILKELALKKNRNQILVGFSAEDGISINNIADKFSGEDIDLIIANDISRNDIGFESDFNEVIVLKQDGSVKKLKKDNKRIIARKIWDEINKINVN